MRHESAIKAASEYVRGLRLRGEMRQLSEGGLAVKFGRNEKVIRAVCQGMTTQVPEGERQLILSCRKERDRLKGICKGLTVHALAAKHHISRNTLRKYVDDWSE